LCRCRDEREFLTTTKFYTFPIVAAPKVNE
jgi:hypothetical protein